MTYRIWRCLRTSGESRQMTLSCLDADNGVSDSVNNLFFCSIECQTCWWDECDYYTYISWGSWKSIYVGRRTFRKGTLTFSRTSLKAFSILLSTQSTWTLTFVSTGGAISNLYRSIEIDWFCPPVFFLWSSSIQIWRQKFAELKLT